MEPIVCPETSVRIYLYSLRNNSEQRSLKITDLGFFLVGFHITK